MKAEDILLVMALKSESKDKVDVLLPVTYTGVGKVNAAIVLGSAIALRDKKPKLIVNLGTVGSHKYSKFSMLNPHYFIQHDINAQAFGYEPYQTPNEDLIILDNGLPATQFGMPALSEVTLFTGDQFVDDSSKNFESIDMEGYALAKTAIFFSIPFLSIKIVSDGANSDASESWDQTLERCSDDLSSWLSSFLNKNIT